MTFEERLFPKDKEDVVRFQSACRAVFASPQGKVVLGMLCGAAHPLKHSSSMTPHEHGQCEVVATLWRFGSSDTAIPNS